MKLIAQEFVDECHRTMNDGELDNIDIEVSVAKLRFMFEQKIRQWNDGSERDTGLKMIAASIILVAAHDACVATLPAECAATVIAMIADGPEVRAALEQQDDEDEDEDEDEERDEGLFS